MNKKKNNVFKWGISLFLSTICLINEAPSMIVEATKGVSHIGTFDGSTTFKTSSSNGVNPGLFIEVMDEYGNLTQYESEDGVITISDTKEGAYITQAKLLGKTKYRDLDTNEILDSWEEGRNLELVSVESPTLLTHGKNFFSPPKFKPNFIKDSTTNVKGMLYGFEPNTEYVISSLNLYVPIGYHRIGVFKNKDLYTKGSGFDYIITIDNRNGEPFYTHNTSSVVVTSDEQGGIGFYNYFGWSDERFVNLELIFENLQIEKGATVTPFEPYKENIVSFSENTTLRGIGDVRDELDLMTGKVTERIGERLLDGLIYEFKDTPHEVTGNDVVARWNGFGTAVHKSVSMADKIGSRHYGNYDNEEFVMFGIDTIILSMKKSRLGNLSIRDYLVQNPITVYYQLKNHSDKRIKLAHTYTFPSVKQQSVSVNGTVSATIGSITVPTEPLSFTLNPNLEEGQQFVAPEFSVSNDSHAPITLGVKSFEQVTDVLNDVSSDKYSSWEGLNKTESKDIALALVPKASDSWISLTEKPYYVSNTTNEIIGQIKGNSSVEFSFEALHGQAFDKTLRPEYQLTFVFEF